MDPWDDSSTYAERAIYVTCPRCHTRHDERAVEFVDISEDIQGRDLLTFVCPTCYETVRSYRIG